MVEMDYLVLSLALDKGETNRKHKRPNIVKVVLGDLHCFLRNLLSLIRLNVIIEKILLFLSLV